MKRLTQQQRQGTESWNVAEVEHGNTTRWLKYTSWSERSLDRPLEIIAATAVSHALG